MNEEIKEILDKLQERNCLIDNAYYRLFKNEANLLLDYITNLQQENKEWSMIFDTFSKRPYAHKYLEEKKKELSNKKIIGLDSEMIYKDYYDYKSRIEKAVEYLKKHIEKCNIDGYEGKFDNFDIFTKPQKLLNILNGRSDE